ncbi:MAG: transcriptional repressor NrdR [Planctomycetes bacterium]|nr:transcriptional repressor NrdR [Planctomycetota bacterium]
MQCPFCGQDNDKVVDSRAAEGGATVRRRRECLACNRRFTTYERPEETIKLTVVKKDGSREPYDRNKIIVGLQRACYKRKVGQEQISRIVEDTEEAIFKNFDKEVPTNFIGDEVSMRLKLLDKIAYVRFASVYRQFADVGELIDEARGVKDAASAVPGQQALFQPGQTPAPVKAAQTAKPGASKPPDEL